MSIEKRVVCDVPGCEHFARFEGKTPELVGWELYPWGHCCAECKEQMDALRSNARPYTEPDRRIVAGAFKLAARLLGRD